MQLGGISGGPLISEDGIVIGVASSGNNRKGRLNASKPVSIHQLINDTDLILNADVKAHKMDHNNFKIKAEEIRGEYLVAKVSCFVDASKLQKNGNLSP